MSTAVKPKTDKQTILTMYDGYALGLAELICRCEENDDRPGRERAKDLLSAWDSLRADALAGRFD